MKKNFKYYIAAWLVLVLIFNLVCFITPSTVAAGKFGGAFWAGYVLIMLAFVLQLFCAYYALKGDSKRTFLKLSLIRISYSLLFVSFIFGAVFALVPGVPLWVGGIIAILIFGLNAIALLKAQAAAEIVEGKDAEIKNKTAFIRNLTLDAENLVKKAQTETAKQDAKDVFEAIRYSDPMSSDEKIDEEIALAFRQFSAGILSGGDTDKNGLIALIDERNNKCKASK